MDPIRHSRVRLNTGTLLLLGLLLVSADTSAAVASLYDRLGGAPVVNAIASDLIDRTSASHQLGRSFEGAKIDRIKRLLAEQICELAGGPCVYSGDAMREVHAGHEISQAEFYGMVEILQGVLHEHHVALRERNELLALLAPMERDVVEPPKKFAGVQAPR